jgi:hypothetical protein
VMTVIKDVLLLQGTSYASPNTSPNRSPRGSPSGPPYEVKTYTAYVYDMCTADAYNIKQICLDEAS